MTIQENVGALLTYGVESTFGTPPSGSGTSQRTRRISSGLNLMKDAFTSNEVRADQQIATARHGGHRVQGTIRGELSTESYDDFLQALLRGSWAAGAELDESDLTSVVAANATSKFTFGGGDPVALGLFIGAIITFTGLSVAANNGVRFRVTGFGGTSNREVTVYPAPTDNSSDTEFDVAVTGGKLSCGVTKRSFAMEHSYAGIDVAELFDGCRISGASISVPPNNIAQIAFEVMGRSSQVLTGGSAPYYTNATAAPNTDALTGIEGGLRFNDEEVGIITGFDMQIALNMSSAPVIGTPYVPDIFYGRTVITGNISAFLQDEDFLNVFKNETEVDIVVPCFGPGTSLQDFIVFNMQRAKLMGAQKEVNTDGGIIISAPFQALLPETATGVTESSLVIQRSNAVS